MEESMTKEPREIVRDLEAAERGFPCVVAHEDAGGPCERPAVMAVYGLAFCEVHGAECANGALEEMYQDAAEFFDRFDTSHVPDIPNPLILQAVRNWWLTLREKDRVSEEETDELLLAAFPFREDRMVPETAGEIADPIPGQDPPYDAWRYHRYETHILMRHAYMLGVTNVVEHLERERESICAQGAFARALTRGEHPEVLERARERNREDARKAAEHFAQTQA